MLLPLPAAITAKHKQVYKLTAEPIVESVLEGYNGTFFACDAHTSIPSSLSHLWALSGVQTQVWADWYWKDLHHGRSGGAAPAWCHAARF